MSGCRASEIALAMLRNAPRLSLYNLRNNPAAPKRSKRPRAQYGGDKHGCGNKGSGQRQNWMRLGYETGNNPFYLRFPYEPYYKGHHLRRQYPPLSLSQLQLMIDTGRIDTSKPIDLSTICNSGIFTFNPREFHYGVHLTDEGADQFQAKVNIEVQWTSEPVIAAIERNGGVITTAFYDIYSLFIMRDPVKFFEKGEAIPRRMLPPEDAILFYTSPENRGYLADPEAVSWERFVLSQKYGYKLPKIEADPDKDMLMECKDPRQIFYGLEPGWVINLTDKTIIKPLDPEIKEFYKS
ncbi:mitochondrial ribosomal protein L15 [Lycorma delicatula]|uniref:mitochondrial ribosomal protein L15 n=1 Tax=Lycorma delicatula TaxID=130591 RepID=UPI003F51A32B